MRIQKDYNIQEILKEQLQIDLMTEINQIILLDLTIIILIKLQHKIL